MQDRAWEYITSLQENAYEESRSAIRFDHGKFLQGQTERFIQYRVIVHFLSKLELRNALPVYRKVHMRNPDL